MSSKSIVIGLLILLMVFPGNAVMALETGKLTIVTETKPLGQVVTAVIVEYSKTIDPSQVSTAIYQIKANRLNDNGGDFAVRTITKVYTNNKPEFSSEAKAGKYVIIELHSNDANASTIYYAHNELGGFNFNYELEYTLEQQRNIKAIDGTIIPAGTMLGQKRKNLVVDKFENLIFKSAFGQNVAYSLYVPENYDPTQSYPLVLFLHGSGERGDNSQTQLEGNKGAIVWAEDAVQAKYPSFVLAPQCPQDKRWYRQEDLGEVVRRPSEIMNAVYQLLEQLTRKYNIDLNRLYSTGVSMGGFGTWTLNTEYPDLFAAMVPVCGGGDPAQAKVLADKPIWTFHAVDDSVVDVSYSRNMVTALRKLGSNVKYTEYNRGIVASPLAPAAHFAWVPAYNNKSLIDWMYAQHRTDK